jgi:hypothetical protein
MRTFGIISWLAAIVVTVIAFWYDGCKQPKHTTTKTVTYEYDTTTHSGVVSPKQPKSEALYLPSKTIHDTLFVALPVDSMQVVLAYYTARYYERQYLDSNIAITFYDSVYKNTLTHSSFDYRLLRPTAIITQTEIKQAEARNRLYVGLGLAVGLTGVSPVAGPELLWVTKNGNGYRVGYHVGQNLSNISASLYWKIGK